MKRFGRGQIIKKETNIEANKITHAIEEY